MWKEKKKKSALRNVFNSSKKRFCIENLMRNVKFFFHTFHSDTQLTELDNPTWLESC